MLQRSVSTTIDLYSADLAELNCSQWIRSHNLSILMHRRKPDNIGFDGKDSLKLFDFGLAKELKPYKKHADGTYHLTANTGSRRYMAPVSTDARLFEDYGTCQNFRTLYYSV